MAAILAFIFEIVSGLLEVLVWIVIVNAVLSWLIAFGVINLRNRTVFSIARGLDRATTPLLWPLRRFIPPLGGLDITPVIFILVVEAVRHTLLPALFNWLIGLVGGGYAA